MNIVLIHLGEKKINYIAHTIKHLLLWGNKNIYLISNQHTYEILVKEKIDKKIDFIDYTLIKKSKDHEKFIKKTKLEKKWHFGFWLYTTERFFYLQNICEKKKLKDIIHIENDYLIFKNLNLFKEKFKKNYNIGLTMFNSNQCVPGFMYFKNYKYINKLTNYIYLENTKFFNQNKSDMMLIYEFYKKFSTNKVKNLPIMSKELKDALHLDVQKKFYNNYNIFKMIFDEAVIGQYLDGLDKSVHWTKNRSFINKISALPIEKTQIKFNVSLKKNKKIQKPYLIYKKIKLPILGIHMHSKKTDYFIK